MALGFLFVLLAQATAAPVAAPPSLSYRGFTPGMTYREFASRARAMALTNKDILGCQTMHTTAQVMDCGLNARDPLDSARFYLSANIIEGRTSVISFVDSGKVDIVKRAQDDMRRKLGAPQRREHSMWEWRNGHRFVRLNWRGASGWRKVSITLNDQDVLDRIARYTPKPAAPASKPK